MRIFLILLATVYVFARPAVSMPLVEVLDPEAAQAIK